MLSARPLGVQPRGGVISPQPAFMQLVRQELQSKLGDKVKDLSGVKIFTTFDSVAQDAAEKAAVEGIPALKKQRKLSDLETAMVVVDRNTGEVRAMVGGAEPQFAGYNRAMQARRSIGSLAKPATYLTALSQPNLYRLNTGLPTRRSPCVSLTARSGHRRTMINSSAAGNAGGCVDPLHERADGKPWDGTGSACDS